MVFGGMKNYTQLFFGFISYANNLRIPVNQLQYMGMSVEGFCLRRDLKTNGLEIQTNPPRESFTLFFFGGSQLILRADMIH